MIYYQIKITDEERSAFTIRDFLCNYLNFAFACTAFSYDYLLVDFFFKLGNVGNNSYKTVSVAETRKSIECFAESV